MKGRWSDAEAGAAVERWGGESGSLLALRTYSARLIGSDSSLVLHGGGNTSAKGLMRDIRGEERRAVYIKGSGWDLATIEPAGHVSCDLEALERLRGVPKMSDEQMVNEVRRARWDSQAPNASIEALLHAWIPDAFIDHSHADAIVALTNSSEGETAVLEALGGDVALVPYVKPGFDLAHLAANIRDAHPQCWGLVLMHHGLFTFGPDARTSYERHIELVERARRYLENRRSWSPRSVPVSEVAQARTRASQLAPTLRGLLGGSQRRHWVLEHRGSAEVLARLEHPRRDAWASCGPLTPDHIIRTKHKPWVFGDLADRESLVDALQESLNRYRGAVHASFVECAEAAGGVSEFTELDTTPRVIWVPGIGLFGVGTSQKAARIAADIAEHTLIGKEWSAGLGDWRGLSRQQFFEMEYWSLEQAKLGRGTPLPLQGQVAVITGGAGAIGIGVARELVRAGALVALVDRDGEALKRAEEVLGHSGSLMGVQADVADPESTNRALTAVCARWGGLDLLVVNAGVAAVAPLSDMTLDAFRQVSEVNLQGAFVSIQAGSRILKEQGIGGGIVVISTKNVAAPGAGFGAYSATKAAAHQLGKVAAMELAEFGIRVNLVAPDAVFEEGGVPSGLWASVGPDRARSRGLEPEDLPAFYRDRNLLKSEVTGSHVGAAVVFFATEQTPTTGATLPVDGGLPTAFPR